MTREEARHALLAESVRVGRPRAAPEEGERDRGAGPEALQLGAQLIGERDAMTDEIAACARQSAQRLGRREDDQ